MSTGVSKQCSILNYLSHADVGLYNLLQDLCIGKMLIPRNGSPGITFLRPDDKMLKEIMKLAASDEPEKAIEALQSLVILDNLSNIKDFDEKKSDIPTYLRKKLLVTSVSGKKVTLQNNAVIVPDPGFTARKDRSNISVYLISGPLIPSDWPDATMTNAIKIKEKKGGADLGDSRSMLFESVLKAFCDKPQDPAMELLAAMYGWACSEEAKAANDSDKLKDAIKSKASGDTLATLAIILQPYKNNPDYVSNECLGKFREEMYGSDETNKSDKPTFRSIQSFTMNPVFPFFPSYL